MHGLSCVIRMSVLLFVHCSRRTDDPGIHWLHKPQLSPATAGICVISISALLGASRDQSPGNLIGAGGATTMDRLEAVTIPPGDHDMQ